MITAARSSAAGAEVNRSEACTQLPLAYFQRWFERFRAAGGRLLEGFGAGRPREVLERRAVERRRFPGAAVVHRQHVPAPEQRPVHRAVAARRAEVGERHRFDRGEPRPPLDGHHRPRGDAPGRRLGRVEAVGDRDVRARGGACSRAPPTGCRSRPGARSGSARASACPDAAWRARRRPKAGEPAASATSSRQQRASSRRTRAFART